MNREKKNRKIKYLIIVQCIDISWARDMEYKMLFLET